MNINLFGSNQPKSGENSLDFELQAKKDRLENYVRDTVQDMIKDKVFHNIAANSFNKPELEVEAAFPDVNASTFNMCLPGPGRCGGSPPDDDPPIDSNTFNLDYVGGLDEVVKYLRRNVVFPWLAGTPNSGKALGDIFEPAKGIIFYGPPGTGKTLMGKCLVGELQKLMGKKVSFIMRRGTDTFSKWVGESEANLRQVFLKAERIKPTVIFFDEIDGLVPARREGQHEHRISIVTTFLGMVDKVKRGEVFIIGATNRLDALDPAALRPGRFDKHICFTPPNEAGRVHILNMNLNKWARKKPNRQEIAQIAARTVGFTGADLEQLIRNAINCAIERDFPDLGSNIHDLPKALGSLKNIQVNYGDWLKALSGMSSTNANVFGSTIYCGNPVTTEISPLVGGIVRELKSKIDGFYDLCVSHNSGTGINSFLYFGVTESEILAIDTLIIPAVIGSFDSIKVKAFIASDSGQDIFEALAKASSGAIEKPSILFIPRIDKLWITLLKNGIQHSFLEQVEETRCKDLLILSSALCARDAFPLELQQIFQGVNRSIRIRKPTQEEIRQFFLPIFTVNSAIHENFAEVENKQLKWNEKQLNGIFNKAVLAATGEDIRTVLSFHQELLLVFSSHYKESSSQKPNISQALTGTVEAFIRTKFLD